MDWRALSITFSGQGESEMRTFRSIIMVIALLVIAASGINCSKSSDNQNAQARAEKSSPKVVSVDKLVRRPDKFKGTIGVNGAVSKLDEAKGVFVLGCGDACVSLPVKFQGKMPAVGTKVTVYGEITKTEDGKYVFAGQRIEAGRL